VETPSCTTTPRTYYFASGLVAGQYYTFYVVARDAAGNLSAPSAQYTARAQAGLPMPTVSPTPSPRPGCGITYRTSGWRNGFTATVGVTNTGGVATNGWTLRLTFPGNQKVVTAWPATWGQSGPSAWFANPGWNAEFSPGETVTLGFTATYTGADTRPTGFTVNGVSCAVEYL
jgi:endoglucanase